MSKFIFVYLSITCILLFSCTAFAKKKIAIIVPTHIRPYIEVVEGVKKTISSNTLEIFFLEKNKLYVKQTLVSKSWNVIVTIGSSAKNFAEHLHIKSDHFIYSMVVYPQRSKKFDCGIYLMPDPDEIMDNIIKYIGKYKPVKDILIPYSSHENDFYINLIKQYSAQKNINIIDIYLSKNKNFFDSLKKSDVVLLIPDPILYSKEIALSILENAFLYKKPVVGYNRYLLDNGAYLCFIVNYKRVGIELGDLINNIIGNKICTSHNAYYDILINDKIKKYIFGKGK